MAKIKREHPQPTTRMIGRIRKCAQICTHDEMAECSRIGRFTLGRLDRIGTDMKVRKSTLEDLQIWIKSYPGNCKHETKTPSQPEIKKPEQLAFSTPVKTNGMEKRLRSFAEMVAAAKPNETPALPMVARYLLNDIDASR